jgi:cytochrome P450
MDEMLLNQWGTEHARLRNSVALAFTPRNVNRHRAQMRAIVSRLLDEWVPKGQFDFVEFATEFPIRVLCGLLGVPGDDIPPDVREALEAQASSLSLNRDLLPILLEGYHRQWEFVDRLIVEREQSGGLEGGALLDAMIVAKDSGAISERELRHLLMVLFPAGYDTSKNSISMTMYHMLSRPDDWARCAEDPGFCTKVVDEMFRHSAVTTPYRTVVEEFEYDGVRFTKGSLLIFATLLAGRDPAAYPDPMRFDPERSRENRHVGFGRGAHICLGQHLARAQLEEAIHVIAQRIINPRPAGEVTWRRFLGVWGPRTLPIVFEPG